MQSKLETQSITLRIPKNLLEQIEARSTARRNRSQVIIDLLEQALSLKPDSQSATSGEAITRTELAVEAEKLTALVLELRSEVDRSTMESHKVLRRLTEIEKQLESKTVLQSETGDSEKVNGNDVLQGQTEQKNELDTTPDTTNDSVLQIEIGAIEPLSSEPLSSQGSNSGRIAENLFILPEEQELMNRSRIVNSTALLPLLKREQPDKNWTSTALSEYRRGKRQTKWHTIGNLKFRYAEEQKNDTKYKKHFWQLVEPDLESHAE